MPRLRLRAAAGIREPVRPLAAAARRCGPGAARPTRPQPLREAAPRCWWIAARPRAVLDALVNEPDPTRDPSHVRESRLSEWRSILVGCGLPCDVPRGWQFRLEFDGWVRRARVAPAGEAGLGDLFGTAPEACRQASGIEIGQEGRPRAFRVHCALLRGIRG